jgi:two-component system cell cycle sensor histidine kinase/response regulator CckA
MPRALQVLIVEDSEDDATLLLRELRRAGFEPVHERVDTAAAMAAALKERSWDIVISDYAMPEFSGPAALRLVKEGGHDVPVIMVSGAIGEDTAVETMKAGAADYLTKNNLTRLGAAVERELMESESRRQRRRTEEALHESEALFRTLSTSSPLGVFMTDPDGRCTYVNPRYRAIVGLSLMESMGDGWLRCIHPEDRERVRAQWTAFVHGGAEYAPECRIQPPHGEPRWVQARAAEMRGEDGKLIGYVGTVADITERKRGEQALREAETKYRTLVEQLPAVIYIAELGRAGRWHYVSPQIEPLLGFAPSEFMADPGLWFKQLHPEDQETIAAQEQRCQQTGAPFRAEYRMVARDGRVVWCRDEAVVLRTESDGRTITQGVLLDITERKSLEEQLLQAQKVEAIGRLAGGVAHDFNNILTVILGCSDLLLRQQGLGAASHKTAEEIRKAAERAAGLTRQLLAFSRKQMLEPKVLDLNQAVAQLEKMLRRLIGEDITIVTVPSSAPACVKADPGQIEQLIMNMVVNARDAMPDGGTITIGTQIATLDDRNARQHGGLVAGEYVVLSIADTGTGMSEEIKAHIFEPFFTTKDKGKGTGLGLATCYGIVKQSAGHIEVQSELGHGTTFKIYLPRVEGVAEVSSARPDTGEVSRGSETILLVEDEEAVRELTSMVLTELGYKVLEAGDGEEALRIAQDRAREMQLVITDVVMPGLSGPELVTRLREWQPQANVLFCSGYTADAIGHLGVLDGGISFLQKPFTPEILARKVRETLQGTNRRQTDGQAGQAGGELTASAGAHHDC